MQKYLNAVSLFFFNDKMESADQIFHWLVFNHFASVDVYTSKTFPNCKTEDVYTRFAALF